MFESSFEISEPSQADSDINLDIEIASKCENEACRRAAEHMRNLLASISIMKTAILERFSNANSGTDLSLVAKLNQYKIAIIALKAQLTATSNLKNELDHYRNSLTMSKSTVDDYRNLLEEGNKQREYLRQELDLSRKESSILRAQIEQIKQEPTLSDRKLANLPERKSTNYFEVDNLHREIGALKAEIDGLKTRNQLLNQENIKFSDTLDSIKSLVQTKKLSILKKKKNQQQSLTIDWFKKIAEILNIPTLELIVIDALKPKDKSTKAAEEFHPSLQNFLNEPVMEDSYKPAKKRKMEISTSHEFSKSIDSSSVSSSPVKKPPTPLRRNPSRLANKSGKSPVVLLPQISTDSTNDVDLDRTPKIKKYKSKISISARKSSSPDVLKSSITSVEQPTESLALLTNSDNLLGILDSGSLSPQSPLDCPSTIKSPESLLPLDLITTTNNENKPEQHDDSLILKIEELPIKSICINKSDLPMEPSYEKKELASGISSSDESDFEKDNYLSIFINQESNKEDKVLLNKTFEDEKILTNSIFEVNPQAQHVPEDTPMSPTGSQDESYPIITSMESVISPPKSTEVLKKEPVLKDLLLEKYSCEEVEWFIKLMTLKMVSNKNITILLNSFLNNKQPVQQMAKELKENSDVNINIKKIFEWIEGFVNAKAVPDRAISLVFAYLKEINNLNFGREILLILVAKYCAENLLIVINIIGKNWPEFWQKNLCIAKHLKRILVLVHDHQSLIQLNKFQDWRKASKFKNRLQDHIFHSLIHLDPKSSNFKIELECLKALIRFIYRVQINNTKILIKLPWFNNSKNSDEIPSTFIQWILDTHFKDKIEKFSMLSTLEQNQAIVLCVDLILFGCDITTDLPENFPKSSFTKWFRNWSIWLFEFANWVVSKIIFNCPQPTRICLISLLRIIIFNPIEVFNYSNTLTKLKIESSDKINFISYFQIDTFDCNIEQILDSCLEVLRSNKLDDKLFESKIKELLLLE